MSDTKKPAQVVDETTIEPDPNEIPIEELPVEVHAYHDEHGYALVLSSEDARIGDSTGKLVKNFLVRIVGGDVPKVDGVHAVHVTDGKVRSVGVAEASVDERGRLFVKSAEDGVRRPAVQDDQQK